MDLAPSRRQIWIGVAEFRRLEQAALRHGLTRRELADAILRSAEIVDTSAKQVKKTKRPAG
jgi:hypothetical protein